MTQQLHAMEQAMQSCLRLLETTRQPSTMQQYRQTARLFLHFLRETFPEVRHDAR